MLSHPAKYAKPKKQKAAPSAWLALSTGTRRSSCCWQVLVSPHERRPLPVARRAGRAAAERWPPPSAAATGPKPTRWAPGSCGPSVPTTARAAQREAAEWPSRTPPHSATCAAWSVLSVVFNTQLHAIFLVPGGLAADLPRRHDSDLRRDTCVARNRKTLALLPKGVARCRSRRGCPWTPSRRCCACSPEVPVRLVHDQLAGLVSVTLLHGCSPVTWFSLFH